MHRSIQLISNTSTWVACCQDFRYLPIKRCVCVCGCGSILEGRKDGKISGCPPPHTPKKNFWVSKKGHFGTNYSKNPDTFVFFACMCVCLVCGRSVSQCKLAVIIILRQIIEFRACKKYRSKMSSILRQPGRWQP